MRLTVKSDLKAEANEMTQRRLQLVKDTWAKLRSVSFLCERWVKAQMPKDTGRARASWGHWSPGDLNANANASSLDAVWEEHYPTSITQGSNVEYIGRLNDGWSQQAPAGFLDMLERKAVEQLDAEIDSIIQAW